MNMNELLIIDAFVRPPFRGNPAAVCLLDEQRDEAWMQELAAEMNLSETAFVQRRAEGDWSLRWFTPRAEVDLCGHATMAAAAALWHTGRTRQDGAARFLTRSGWLTVERDEAGIHMNFPAIIAHSTAAPAELSAALGGAAWRYVGWNGMDYLVELEAGASLRQVRVDFARLLDLPSRGVIVTSAGAHGGPSGTDFASRFFAPRLGVNEDPVTGSAHSCLGPYWAERFKKSSLLAFQASERGGVLGVTVMGDRVRLSGQVRLVLQGRCLI